MFITQDRQDPNMDNSLVAVLKSLGTKGDFGHFRSLGSSLVVVFDSQGYHFLLLFYGELRSR